MESDKLQSRGDNGRLQVVPVTRPWYVGRALELVYSKHLFLELSLRFT